VGAIPATVDTQSTGPDHEFQALPFSVSWGSLLILPLVLFVVVVVLLVLVSPWEVDALGYQGSGARHPLSPTSVPSMAAPE